MITRILPRIFSRLFGANFKVGNDNVVEGGKTPAGADESPDFRAYRLEPRLLADSPYLQLARFLPKEGLWFIAVHGVLYCYNASDPASNFHSFLVEADRTSH